MINYFKGLFSIGCNDNFGNIIDKFLRCITFEMRTFLDSPVTDKEILEAFNQMDPRKALGIDCLSSLFYKEN